MKRSIWLMLLLVLASCGDGSSHDTLPLKGTVSNPNVTLFPKSKDGYVGDPMPYFDGEKMHYFYLLNESVQSAVGFHPWSLLSTSDLLNYEDVGVVIPYEKDPASQDLALGTGSVIKDKTGLYHAFYTGYNGTGNTDFHEKVQHATSEDLHNWTKHPEDGFFGGHNDFRDPYVLYMESENMYWMIVTTRDNNTGVLKLYKSSNLTTWNYHSIFFRNDAGSYNMECPTLIKYGQYWYLSYSEQGAFRVTHYRYTSDLSSGVWTKPSVDYFDGVGVYAGRMEIAWDKLYFAGWQAIKQYDYDGGDFDWGGNLVTHQMKQMPNGELTPMATEAFTGKVNHLVHYPLTQSSSTLEIDNNSYSFAGENYQYAIFDKLEKKPTIIEFSLDIKANSGQFGLSFSHQASSVEGATNIVFNLDSKRLEFYNVKTTSVATSIPQAFVPFDPNEPELKVKVVSEHECLTVYVENQSALSVRMYSKTNKNFGFFAHDTSVSFNQVAFYE